MRAAIEHNRALPLTTEAIETLQYVLGAVMDGAWGPETTGKLKAWQQWKAERTEELPASCHGYIETDGTFGPFSQYAMGVTHPDVLQKHDSTKWARPDRTETIYKMARQYGLVLGFDLFRGNDEPDWCQMASLGHRVFTGKIGEKLRDDTRFVVDRLLRAKGAGLDVNGYLWFSDEVSPERQARALEKMLEKVTELDIPVAMDFEKDYLPKNTPAELRAKGNRFVEAFRPALMLYGGLHFMNSDLDIDKPQPGPLDDLPRWVARYPTDIDKGVEALWADQPTGPWAGWQLTSSGAHPSITKKGLLDRFDVNVWKPTELDRLKRLQRGEDCA